jgi:hypothetical protein
MCTALRARGAVPGMELFLPNYQRGRGLLAQGPSYDPGRELVLRLWRARRGRARAQTRSGRVLDRSDRRRLPHCGDCARPHRQRVRGGLQGRAALPSLDLFAPGLPWAGSPLFSQGPHHGTAAKAVLYFGCRSLARRQTRWLARTGGHGRTTVPRDQFEAIFADLLDDVTDDDSVRPAPPKAAPPSARAAPVPPNRRAGLPTIHFAEASEIGVPSRSVADDTTSSATTIALRIGERFAQRVDRRRAASTGRLDRGGWLRQLAARTTRAQGACGARPWRNGQDFSRELKPSRRP